MAFENVIATAGVRMVPVMDRFASTLQREATTQTEKVAAQMATTGRNLTRAVTLPVLGLVAAITTVGVKFETTLSRIKGLVGASETQMAQYRRAILDLAPKVGQGPEALAEALYFITSAGLSGALALDALEQSAKAATAGLGETATIADAVTSAMNAYGPEVVSAAHATDVLVATVREGKAEADAIAESMGKVIPLAANLGISFDQVGAAVASMTRLGLDAFEATTALRGIMSTLLDPSQQARDVLEQFGLSAEGLRQQIREKGLLDVLFTLRERFGDNEEAIATVFPNVRALTGVLNLVGENADEAQAIFDRLAGTTGDLGNAFSAAAETDGFKFQTALADLKVALIDLGEIVVPVITGMATALGGLVKAIGALPDPIQKVGLGFLGLVAAIGPVMFIGSKLLGLFAALTLGETGMYGMKLAVANLGEKLTKFAAFALNPWVIGITAAIAIFTVWNNQKKEAKARVEEYTASLDANSGAITQNTKATVIDRLEKEGVIKELLAAGVSVGDYTEAILGNEEAQKRSTTALREAHEAGLIGNWGLVQLAGTLHQETAALEEAQESQIRKNDAMRAGLDLYVPINRQMETMGGVLARNRVEVDNVTSAFTGMTVAQASAATAAEPYERRLRTMNDLLIAAYNSQTNLSDALLEAASPLFAAQNAAKNYADTLKQVDEDGQRTAEEQLLLAEAALRAQAAMDAFSADGITLEVDALATALGIPRAEAQKILETLGLINGKTVKAFVDVSTLQSRITLTPSGGGSQWRIRAEALGGWNNAGDMALVGEQGPEIIRFGPGGGQVYPNGVSAPGGSSGRPINLTVRLDSGVLARAVLPAMVDEIEVEAGAWRT